MKVEGLLRHTKGHEPAWISGETLRNTYSKRLGKIYKQQNKKYNICTRGQFYMFLAGKKEEVPSKSHVPKISHWHNPTTSLTRMREA